MLVHISDITIKKRIRKDVHGIDELADSIRKYGLLNPVVLDSNYVLIAGFRRLQAAKQLGWTSVPATVVDVQDKIGRMEIELEENVQRTDFTQEEMLDGYASLDKLKNPVFFRRLVRKIKAFFTSLYSRFEQKSAGKRRKNALLSLTAPLAVIAIVLSGILHKKEYISSLMLSVLNSVSLVLFVCGAFFFIRFIIGSKKAARKEKASTD